MTQLLVSVRDAAEAHAALDGGADWIDLKEPTSGPLGAVTAIVARNVAEVAEGRASLSAAAGELLDWPHSAARDLLAVDGVTQLKLGLSACADGDWQQAWLAAQREIIDAGKELVAVVYADADRAHSPAPFDVLEAAAAARARWLLIDTFDKGSGTLLELFEATQLRALFERAQALGLTTAAAGRLTPAAIEALPLDAIDVVAVRSAACGGDRRGTVNTHSVAALQTLLRGCAIF
ncbi:(5-formylfuran-3-yl)methyl phosphate synthase [Lacipirellula sp.]|uniref:(5-formylfuran-3-yl)methyl phosphate synthase n=1 Tax=Lacipirellula sp. TaxID=2691419 RepID=UPI003D12AAA6